MADTASYLAQMLSGTGLTDKSLQEIIAQLGGTNNPSNFAYTPMEAMPVNIPQLLDIATYLQNTGATGYQYDYSDILNALNQATELQWQATQNAQRDAENVYLRGLENNQQTAADTIKNQYAQAIQAGITKGLQNANLLSTILGTSQNGVQGLKELADQRYQAGLDYAASLGNNINLARTEANTALETLLGNIRQLYNDDIQRETAELEYNASVGETNANAAAQRYTADSNYAASVLNAAANQKNQLVAALAQLAAQAANSSAQDNYSGAYATKTAGGTSGGSGGSAGDGGGTGGGAPTPTTQTVLSDGSVYTGPNTSTPVAPPASSLGNNGSAASNGTKSTTTTTTTTTKLPAVTITKPSGATTTVAKSGSTGGNGYGGTATANKKNVNMTK